MYIIGIDGGGTKTKISIIDEFGTYLGSDISGPSSIDTVDINVTLENISVAINNIITKNNFGNIHISSIFAGLGGIGSEADKKLVNKAILSLPYCDSNTYIDSENDVFNALAGGTMARPGIAIIIGTGSVAFGIDESGNSFRAGGYTYKEGDAGSSYDLGRKTLQTLARVLDNRYPTSEFINEIKLHLNIFNFSDAVKVFDKLYMDRTKTASLSKFVTKYADLGDINALRIIEKATSELALMINAVNKTLNLKNKEIAIIGSLGNASSMFKEKFIKKVRKIDKSFYIHESLIDPSIGACLLALKNIGISLNSDVLNNLKNK